MFFIGINNYQGARRELVVSSRSARIFVIDEQTAQWLIIPAKYCF
jgi:hypothetical protein